MPNRYGDNPEPQPNPEYIQDFNHPQAAINHCNLLRPLSAGIAALVAEAEREHGQPRPAVLNCTVPPPCE